MIGYLGRDEFADQFAAQLEHDSIDATHVHRQPDVGTGIGNPLVEDTGENSIVIVQRANHCLRPSHIEEASELITGASVLLVQFELPFDTIVAAAARARAAGVTVICNPAPARTSVDELRGLIDVIVPNHGEAALLTGGSQSDPPEQLARRLEELTGATVVMTLGAAGTLVADGANPRRLAAHTVPVIDTVGAGDAFCGTLAARLADGRTLADAVTQANAAGALAVTTPGAEPSMPTAAAVAELLGRLDGAGHPEQDGASPAPPRRQLHP
jgi:ribokinase